MTGYAWLGPVGELRGVPCPQAGVPVGVERVGSEWLTLGGSRVVQRGRRVHRSWDFGFTWDRPADLAWFTELASGGVVGPHYLYTSKAAAENLAPTQLQSGGSGVVAGRRVLAAGDREVAVSRVIPVKPNTSYTLSFLSNGSGTVTRRLLDAAGTQISSTALAGSTAGVRASVTFTTTAATYGITLTPTVGVGQVRLTEGPHTGFQTGDGVPPVEILDPQETLQRVMAGDHRSDFTITVKETG